MTTAQEILTASMTRANLIGSGQTPGSTVNTVSLVLLNDMIASWKNKGLDLQLSELDAGDTVYLDRSDLLAVKVNLALLIAEAYKIPMPQRTVMYASELYDDLSDKYLQANTDEMDLPSSLVESRRFDIRTDS